MCIFYTYKQNFTVKRQFMCREISDCILVRLRDAALPSRTLYIN
jgi:hypothetical protein